MSPFHSSLFPAFPSADFHAHRAALKIEMRRVLELGHFVMGDEGQAFELEFANWVGAAHAIGTANGTDAIELMLRALDIGAGSSVVVPALAPSAVASGVLRAGAQVLFADVDPETFTMSAESLELILNSAAARNAKAVLAVHLYGQPVDWSGLQTVAMAHGVRLLEDAAQAHGATWRERRAGALGHAAAFSFYPTKNLAALGDAGAVVTNDDALRERLRTLRQYGWQERYVSAEAGVNSRMDELQAAVLRVKLRTIDDHLHRRRELAAIYDRYLGSAAPVVRADCEHGRHLYVIRHQRRDVLLRRLSEQGIPAAVHYPMALHQQPAFASPAPLPVAEQAVKELISLPLHPYLTPEAIELVCNALD